MKDDYLSEFLEGWAPIRTVSRDAALAVFPPISAKLHINPQMCSYIHVEVEGKVYRRVVEDERREYWKDLPRYCHDCGIAYGNIHHVACDIEVCPKCDGQFIACDCHRGRYFMGRGDRTGKDGIESERYLPFEHLCCRKYSENREEGLQAFIEHNLYDKEFMKDHTVDELKGMAREFDTAHADERDSDSNDEEKGFEAIALSYSPKLFGIGL